MSLLEMLAVVVGEGAIDSINVVKALPLCVRVFGVGVGVRGDFDIMEVPFGKFVCVCF